MKREIKGMLTGLGVTFRTMMKPAVTVQYPHEREDPAPRARGVIALKEENCTVCMLCARSCPDWCIYIEGHKEQRPPRREGGRPRSVSLLDRFDIDPAVSSAVFVTTVTDVTGFFSFLGLAALAGLGLLAPDDPAVRAEASELRRRAINHA